MSGKRLKRKFFERDTQSVAKELLGKVVVRRIHDFRLAGRIVEVEAYVGEDDLACHAAKGRTARTEVMFGNAGHAYVYFIYGMYYCLNIVTGPKDFPAAVLIRALEPIDGVEYMQRQRGIEKIQHLTNGPGKLCQALQIDKRFNGEDMTVSDQLFITDDGFAVPTCNITQSARIGVDYAGTCALYPWRYYLRGHSFVSR